MSKNTYYPTLPIGQGNVLLDDMAELEATWPEFKRLCTCGARVTYGQDTILHSTWCDAYEDKYARKMPQNDPE
jgi:hypothetical protein